MKRLLLLSTAMVLGVYTYAQNLNVFNGDDVTIPNPNSFNTIRVFNGGRLTINGNITATNLNIFSGGELNIVSPAVVTIQNILITDLTGVPTISVGAGSTLDIQDDNFTIPGDANVTIDGNVNVNGNFNNLSDNTTVNGDLNSTGNIFNSGTIGGAGTVTADGTSTNFGGGTIFGDSSTNPDCTTGCQDGTLPIELLSFSVNAETNSIRIQWETATEINNDFFTLERSIDGIEYEVIATISGAGNSNNVLRYEYQDHSPFNGLSFYRLRQTDFDGQFEVFSPLAIIFSGDLPPFDLRQNPIAQGELSIISRLDDDRFQLQLYSVSGETLATRRLEFGENRIDTRSNSSILIARIMDPIGNNVTTWKILNN